MQLHGPHKAYSIERMSQVSLQKVVHSFATQKYNVFVVPYILSLSCQLAVTQSVLIMLLPKATARCSNRQWPNANSTCAHTTHAWLSQSNSGQKGSVATAKPVTNDHLLGPEKAVSVSGRWSLVRGLHPTTIIMNVIPSVPGEVVCSHTRLVARHGGL